MTSPEAPLTKNSSAESKPSRDTCKKRWIEDLQIAGFPLMPLIGMTKDAFTTEWQHIQPDPAAPVSNFPNNYAVILLGNILVIDVDPRNFVTEDNPLRRLCDDIGITNFDTYTIKSGGGGVHIYLHLPCPMRIRSKLRRYKGLDFKTYGHYLVGPGSIHPDTLKTYKVVKGSPTQLQAVPEKLIGLIEFKQKETENVDVPIDEIGSIRRFTEYVKNNAPEAIQGNDGDPTTYITACKGRDMGLSAEKTYEILAEHWNPRCVPMWSERGLRRKIANAFMYAKDAPGNAHPDAGTWDDLEELHAPEIDGDHREESIIWHYKKGNTGVDKELKNILTNVENYYRLPAFGEKPNPIHRLVKYNRFSDTIEFNFPAPWHEKDEFITEWRDNDAIKFRSYVGARRGWDVGKDVVHDGTLSYAMMNSYHPIRLYLNGLKWDGVKRIDSLLPHYTGAEDNSYTQAVGRKLLIGMVARVMEPGCKLDTMVILEGATGTGKSTFCSILGGKYYTEVHIDPHDKDTKLIMEGKWLGEVSEIVCIRKVDADALKKFLSTATDRIRKPYGRLPVDIKRQCVFVGTTNHTSGYLTDNTGNRRFLPVKTNTIRLNDLQRDRDMLFAEAYEAYRNGEPHYINDPDVLAVAEYEQHQRLEFEAWGDIITHWLNREERAGMRHFELSSRFIGSDILGLPMRAQDRNTYNKIQNAMVQLGWKRVRMLEDCAQVRGYRRISIMSDLVDGI